MTNTPPELSELRDEIDSRDEDIVDNVAARVAVAEDVAAAKARRGDDLVDEERERAVKARYADRFRERGLPPERGEELAEFLIDIALEREREIEDSA